MKPAAFAFGRINHARIIPRREQPEQGTLGGGTEFATHRIDDDEEEDMHMIRERYRQAFANAGASVE